MEISTRIGNRPSGVLVKRIKALIMSVKLAWITNLMFTISAGFICVLMTSLVAAQSDDDVISASAAVDRLEQLGSKLLQIPIEQGGGYFLSSELSGLRDGDFADLVKIPRIRQLEDNDYTDNNGFGPPAWAQFGKLTELEALESYNDFVTHDDLHCLTELRQLKVLVLSDRKSTRLNSSHRH